MKKFYITIVIDIYITEYNFIDKKFVKIICKRLKI